MPELVFNWHVRLFDLLAPERKAELLKLLQQRFELLHLAAEEAKRQRALDHMIAGWNNYGLDGDAIVGDRNISDKVYDL